MSPTHYDALGLAPGASLDEVRAAYRRLAREHHPDRAGADGKAMARINTAYEVLSHPERRARYDQQLASRPAPRKPGRVVLPGDRRRTRLVWGVAGVGVLVVAALAVLAGLRARASVAETAHIEPLSHPLPIAQPPAQRTTPAEGLRLIPSRSIAAVPPGAGRGETTARSR